MKKSNVFTGSLLLSLCLIAVVLPVAGFEFSQAGYWPAPGSPRRVTNFNLGWEFSLDGFKTTRPVSLPHGIDEGELSAQASGCVNRQQEVWYRKRFSWRRTAAKSFLHFEAVMGKCRAVRSMPSRLARGMESRCRFRKAEMTRGP